MNKSVSGSRYPVTGRAQSMFEVIFAIAVAALILVGITSLAATSVKNSSFSTNNAVATKYAQEAVEWLREERDNNWNTFAANATGTEICLGSSPPSWGGSCKIPNAGLERKVTLTTIPSGAIEAVVVVSWVDNQGVHSARSVTRFTNWNK